MKESEEDEGFLIIFLVIMGIIIIGICWCFCCDGTVEEINDEIELREYTMEAGRYVERDYEEEI